MEFIYRAFDKAGREIQGLVIANDVLEAHRKIRENGLIVLELKEQKSNQISIKKISTIDNYRTFQQLSILLKTGISLDSALKICIDSSDNKQLKILLDQILRNIKSGKDVHKAFYDTGSFSPFIITMIKIGEKTGNLKEVFFNLAEYTLFNIKFKTELKNAMIYPIFLIIASFVAILGIFKIIIPRFFSIFAEGTENLPLLAKVIYNLSLSMNLKNFLISIGIMSLLIIFFRTRDVKSIYYKILDYMLIFPFLNKFLIELELSRFFYAISIMLKSKVDFIDALNYASDIIKSEQMKTLIKKSIPIIKEGKSISAAFSEITFMPSIVKGTIKVGEESGKLADMFYELYLHFDDRFKNSIKKFLNLLEPIIITFMGIFIGLIVLSLILTVMSISNIKL